MDEERSNLKIWPKNAWMKNTQTKSNRRIKVQKKIHGTKQMRPKECDSKIRMKEKVQDEKWPEEKMSR